MRPPLMKNKVPLCTLTPNARRYTKMGAGVTHENTHKLGNKVQKGILRIDAIKLKANMPALRAVTNYTL